jgi:hypothetical protein
VVCWAVLEGWLAAAGLLVLCCGLFVSSCSVPKLRAEGWSCEGCSAGRLLSAGRSEDVVE